MNAAEYEAEIDRLGAEIRRLRSELEREAHARKVAADMAISRGEEIYRDRRYIASLEEQIREMKAINSALSNTVAQVCAQLDEARQALLGGAA